MYKTISGKNDTYILFVLAILFELNPEYSFYSLLSTMAKIITGLDIL